MALTKVQVISNALTIMGKKPILNLNNADSITQAMEQAFDFKYLNALESGFWRFATTIVQLTQLVQVPIGGYYSYAYQLPANFQKLVHLWPQQYDFDIYQNQQLYTNFNSAPAQPVPPPPYVPSNGQPLYLEYVFQVDYALVPNYFWNYFVYELAMYAALSNAQAVQYMQALQPLRDTAWGVALAADAQNRPQTPLQSKPMITRRFVSTFASG